VASHSMTKYAL